MAAEAAWRIGVDVGGTFTDLVLADAGGAIQVFKVPSVPVNPGRGVRAAVEAAAAAQGCDAATLLRATALFVHGTTIATNALLQRKGAAVGMLTTAGFRDSLEIRRGIRDNPWAHREPYAPVLVPRHRRLGIGGRIDARGRELAPLDRDAVVRAADLFRAEAVEAVAICFLNAFVNPAHEDAAAAILESALPGVPVTRSTAVAPVLGEYERGSTAVMNAYLGPVAAHYLRALDTELRDLGLPVPLLLLQSNGGAAPVAQAAARPVGLLLSGPAAGVGALELVAEASGTGDLILMEIGGTSCDVTLMADRRVEVSDAQQIEGYHLAVPTVDIHTVGAGGGTIARVEGSGGAALLAAGPEGAGARPGPACYGFGGTRPTVTDAQLVLGRLKPGRHAGGALDLRQDLAERAIATQIAGPLGIPLDRAAAGILAVVEQNLLHAVEKISIERGRDPRRFTLVAAGGAGPMHGVPVARRLGMRAVCLPRLAGAFCALGLLNADLRQDHVRMGLTPLDQAAALAPVLDALEAEATAALATGGFPGSGRRMLRELDLRYRGQQWDVRLPIADTGLDPARIRTAFETVYDRLFGHVQPGGAIEITAARVAGIGSLPRLAPRPAAAATAEPVPVEQRSVWIGGARRTIPVYAGTDLAPGHRLTGPLLVEEATTTLVIDGADRVSVDAAGNYRVDLEGSGLG